MAGSACSTSRQDEGKAVPWAKRAAVRLRTMASAVRRLDT